MRVSYWDNWKGIAIIAVIAIHASSGTATFEKGSFNWLFGITLRQFIDFAVPFFLAMSGYFSLKGSSERPITYYKERFIRIIIPYLVWTAVYLLIKTPKDLPSFKECFEGVFLGTGIGIGYFVIVLSQFVLLTPLLSRIHKKTSHLAIMATLSVLGSIFVYYFSALNQSHLLSKFPAYALPLIVWYPSYHAGYFLARFYNKKEINNTLNKIFIFGLAAALALSLLEGFMWAYNNNYAFGASQLKATSLIASMFLFFVAVSFKDRKSFLDKNSPIAWLGTNSYTIYLTHLLFLGVIQKLLKRSDVLYSIQPLFILTSVAITLISCAILVKAAEKLLPKKLSKNILGN